MIGIVVRAAAIVVLTACFPQNRIFSWVLLRIFMAIIQRIGDSGQRPLCANNGHHVEVGGGDLNVGHIIG